MNKAETEKKKGRRTKGCGREVSGLPTQESAHTQPNKYLSLIKALILI